jgi:hypothetical protein
VSAKSAATLRNSFLPLPGPFAWIAIAALLCLSFRISSISAQQQHEQRPAAPPTCATCHAGVTNSFRTAPMRHAMEPDGANPTLASHPDLTVKLDAYTYTVQTRNGHSTYSVTDGTDTVTLPIHWIFGQHTQTWVLEKDGHFYESLVSYFPRDNTLATTPGDQRITPHTIEESMGRRLPVWETRVCFDCHATGVGNKLEVSKITPGLQCEHCHSGSQQHMADAARDNFKTLPPSLKHLDAEQISNFCGQCHRTFDTVMRNRWHGPAFVRFQPYRMALSKCFIGNDPRISCTACHNPHQTLNHSSAYYDSKCLACHGETKTAAVASPANTCKVAKSDCASCHMPKVELPGGHAQFTDHFIRIVKPGESYPE